MESEAADGVTFALPQFSWASVDILGTGVLCEAGRGQDDEVLNCLAELMAEVADQWGSYIVLDKYVWDWGSARAYVIEYTLRTDSHTDMLSCAIKAHVVLSGGAIATADYFRATRQSLTAAERDDFELFVQSIWID